MMSSQAEKQEQARAGNRADFPATASIVDEFRAAFGAGVKLVYAEEGGRWIGRKVADASRFTTVEQWLRMSRVIRADEARNGGVQDVARRGVK